MNELNKIQDLLMQHAKDCRKALLVKDDATRIKDIQFYNNKATKAIQALITEQVRLGRIDGAEELWEKIRIAPKDSWYGTALEHIAQLKDTTLLEGEKK